jgi:ATP-binding cassette subfamily B multidrug efflux pump
MGRRAGVPLTTLLADFMRQHRRPYALAAAMLATIALLGVQVPRRVGMIIDGLVAGHLGTDDLLAQLAWLLAIGLAIYFLRAGWRLQLFKAAYGFGVALRTRLYDRLCLHGPAFYQDQRTGNLMALATNDIDAIEMVAGEAMLAGFDGSVTLILVVVTMVLGVDWRLSLAALLPFPFMAFGFWRISTRVHAAAALALTRFGALNVHVQESLGALRTVRALGLEQRDAARFAALATAVAAADLDAQRWEAAFEPLVGLTLATASTLALAFGGYLMWQGQLSIGALTSFTMYLGLLIWPMFAAGWVLALFERARAAWERLQPILVASVAIADTGVIDLAPAGSLVVDHLGFTYPGRSSAALRELSFCLTPGMTLGVVGATGSGKSTLLKLLLRQLTPDTGSIDWGGQAQSDYRLMRWRTALSWVPQEAFLFSASIAANIALACPQATRAQIAAAAQIAAIDDDIRRWPQGYDTAVGERGITLSGGQRQRVALARALLADASVLLLDDALSAVDTITESRILQGLRQPRAEHPDRAAPRSAIIVRHRLSAVVAADLIIVLRSGAIAARGTHAELLDSDAWYAAQWRYQQLEASLDAL